MQRYTYQPTLFLTFSLNMCTIIRRSVVCFCMCKIRQTSHVISETDFSARQPLWSTYDLLRSSKHTLYSKRMADDSDLIATTMSSKCKNFHDLEDRVARSTRLSELVISCFLHVSGLVFIFVACCWILGCVCYINYAVWGNQRCCG